MRELLRGVRHRGCRGLADDRHGDEFAEVQRDRVPEKRSIAEMRWAPYYGSDQGAVAGRREKAW